MIHEAGTQHTKTSGLEKREAQYSHFLETHGLKKCTIVYRVIVKNCKKIRGDFPTKAQFQGKRKLTFLGRIMLLPTCAKSAHLYGGPETQVR